jgi:hypothetical protein
VDRVEDRRPRAFQFLKNTVDELHSSGRRTLASFLKLELRRRSSDLFNERDLGFSKFLEFLQAAENAGYIKLLSSGLEHEVRPIPRAPEVPPLAATNETNSPSPARASAPAKFIRQDFWRCFVYDSPDSIRLYDPATDRAYRIPVRPRPDESAEVQRIRARASSGSEGFYEIMPISRAEQIEWMREFAEQQAEGRTDLLSVLSAPNAFFKFTEILRSRPQARCAWQQMRVQKIAGRIKKWLLERSLTVELFTSEYVPQRQSEIGKVPAIGSTLSPQSVLGYIAPVIDELINSLFKLRGALDYMQR